MPPGASCSMSKHFFWHGRDMTEEGVGCVDWNKTLARNKHIKLNQKGRRAGRVWAFDIPGGVSGKESHQKQERDRAREILLFLERSGCDPGPSEWL